MPLQVSFVERLEDVVEPAREFLSRDRDLFAKPRIVVPTAGAKAWLWSQLAKRLGASRDSSGHAIGDGIVVNVDVSYPGTISALLEPDDRPVRGLDPWDVEPLTFTILELIAKDRAYDAIVKRAGGPLLAARRIADRFDHYHFRRPGMILEWEEGHARLSPSANEAGVRVDTPLKESDRWQFDLWCAARKLIGQESPPRRDRIGGKPPQRGAGGAAGSAPDSVFVAGLQGLSLHQTGLLSTLARTPSASGRLCDVQVVLVHPSPALRTTWAAAAPPASPGVAPARGESTPTPHADPLVDAWLRGTREAQWLLASQGLEPTHATVPRREPLPAATSLLERLKRTVAVGSVPTPNPGESSFDRTDHSVLIHRCHDLGRQAEVLHDAILHAFRELEDLAPHEVVIVSPQIANLAPHLEATFARHVRGDGEQKVHLPLLVADRGIREVSRGAELLAALIDLVGSRCSVEGMLAVAGHPLVRAHYGLDDDAVDTWQRCIERTRIRWGLDAERRVRDGLDRPALSAHTWRLGLERAILGAVIPDGDPEPVLGGVVPLAHVDAAEIADLAPLASIFGIIDDLDRSLVVARPAGEWCDLLEAALGKLAGEESDELGVPLRELDALRQAAAAASETGAAGVAVPYHDVKAILAATLAAPVGRQPLRTGMITATSMIPFRGVPFRVVCLAGFDNEPLTPRESDADDLADREPRLLGDADPRLELRRGLLDCLLAAEQRLIVTCTGRNVKNNATLPLVTPLAEFVDFVERHGVPKATPDGEEHAAIEVFHPRHACSLRNFLPGDRGVVTSDVAWSHDAAALAAAKALGKEVPRPSPGSSGIEPPTHVELDWLAEFMHDPLWPYVRKTLDIKTWREDDLAIPATIPLDLEHLERRHLLDDYLEGMLATPDRAAFTQSWEAAARANGDVPVLGFGDAALAETTQFVGSLLEVAQAEDVPLGDCQPATLALDLDGISLRGTIDRCLPDADAIRTIVLVRPDASSTSAPLFLRTKMLAVVLLLAARALGHPIERAVLLTRNKEWFPGAVDDDGTPLPAAEARAVTLDAAIDAPRARRLLADLCGLYRQAATAPFSSFGSTSDLLVADPEAAREKFTAFTSSQRYADTNEAVVHGAQPDFDEVFPDDATVTDFFARFRALTQITRTFVYKPDAS